MLIKLEIGEKTKHFLTALYCFFKSAVIFSVISWRLSCCEQTQRVPLNIGRDFLNFAQ